MDKIIDAGNLVSLVSGSKTSEATRGKGAANEGDSFAKVLEQQTGKSEKAAEKTRDVISENKKEDKKGVDARQAAELADKLRGRLNSKPGEMTGMANYLYNIVLKSPESLSMAEKQSFKVGEFSAESLDMKEFQKMLNDRGIKLSDMSFSQIAQMTQHNNRGTVTAFLDDIMQKMKEGAFEKRHPAITPGFSAADFQRTKEEAREQAVEFKLAQESQAVRPDAPGVPQAQSFNEARQTQLAAERNEQRENVIKQIIDRMEIRSVGERTEMTLKLNPEYLGELRVQLSTEGGKMSAQFETTSEEVRSLVEDGIHLLRDGFNRRGLTLDQVKATVVDALT